VARRFGWRHWFARTFCAAFFDRLAHALLPRLGTLGVLDPLEDAALGRPRERIPMAA
jgi:hypothetical protein